MRQSLSVEWLGEQRYADALETQQGAIRDRIAGTMPDRLLLVEHPAVVTLGRSTDPAHLVVPRADLRAKGVDVHEVGRGGDVTYHAPGQLVGYPILDLDGLGRKDVHDHLRRIEAGLMAALESLGIPARRVEGRTGVFVDQARSAVPDGPSRKIASIGVGVRKWVTFHGFALNVSLDLAGFDLIVPCGLHDVVMTSVAAELVREGQLDSVAEAEAGGIDERVRRLVSEAMTTWLGPEAPQVALPSASAE